jgi:WD40 repeat protein
VKVWDITSGNEIVSFRHHIPISGLLGAAFNRDLTTLAVPNYQETDLWDLTTGKELATLAEHRGEVGCLAYSPDGKTLVAASTRYYGRNFRWQGDVKLWDMTTRKERALPEGTFGRVVDAALSPDGSTLALLEKPDLYAEPDLTLLVVDSGKRQVIRAVPGYTFRFLMFTTKGELRVIGTSVDAIRLWQVS